jgi:putative transferase (TIGR04331 family)
MTNWFVREDDAFIVNSYLPLMYEWKLQVSLGQIPNLRRSPKPKPFDADSEPRKRLAQRVSRGAVNGFSDCAAVLLFELLPTCYLEGFSALCAQTGQLPWPARPSFIFTSNDFDTDEIFKCWSARKAVEKIPYYTGQHGNNYGTHRYANPSVEEVTADKFLTWGWTDGLPQHTPAFIFEIAGRKSQSHNPSGGLLLSEVHLNHRIATWDGYQEFKTYCEEQQSFVNKLNPACRDALTIRLHSAYRSLGWSEETRWHDFCSELRIDTGSQPIHALVAESRLVVHSYDSTGMLETLSQNIPTLAFWQNDLDHLRDSARPYYQLLVDAGIVYLTAESAAAKVNEVWDNVEGWWAKNAVQNARKQFCDRYVRVSQNPLCDLKKLLQE